MQLIHGSLAAPCERVVRAALYTGVMRCGVLVCRVLEQCE
jgi:hypothetical protein